MIFDKLVLHNFGPHRHLDLDDLGPVVGITGRNGMGKTHINYAIEFLLTGTVEKGGAMETFVYGYPEPEEPNGYVEGHFRAHGQSGVIFRQHGLSPRMEMTWGTFRTSKATDAAKKLEELFEVGKRSLAATVFLRQGEITTGLFSGQTEREKLFLRIFGLEFTKGVADTIGKKRTDLLANMPDLTAARDQALYAYNQASQAWTEADNAFKEARDFSPDINSLRALQRAADLVASAGGTVSTNVGNRTAAAETLLSLLGSVDPAFATYDAFHAALAASNTAHQQALANYQNAARTQQAITAKRATEASITSVAEEITGLETQLKTLKIVFRPDAKTTLDQELAHLQAFARDTVSRNSLQQTIDQGELQLQQLGTAPETDPEFPQKLQAADERIKKLGEDMLLGRQLESAGFDTNATTICCPTCKQVYNAAGFDLAAYKVQKVELAERQAERSALVTANSQATAALSAYNVQAAGLRDRVAHARTSLAGMPVLTPPARDEAAIRADMQAWQDLNQRIQNNETAVSGKQAELARLQTQLAGYPGDLPTEVAGLAELEAVSSNAKAAYDALHGRQPAIDNAHRSLSNAEAIVAEANTRLTNHIAEENAAKVALTEAASAAMKHTQTMELAIADLTAKQSSFESADARRKSAEAVRDDANNRLNAIDTQIANQGKKRVLGEKLQKLQTAFTRTGIPTTVINDRFGLLVTLTQIFLQQMEAPFSIRLAEDQVATIEFLRNDRERVGWRDMSKMSGGEQMRLSTAFAFAIQQLLLPRLGFLTLDEPSTHLDDGVHQLASMLGNMQERFRNTESQVWVTDHHPALIPAFTKRVHLVAPPMDTAIQVEAPPTERPTEEAVAPA